MAPVGMVDASSSATNVGHQGSLNENVINQGLFYLDWLLDHKAELQLLVQNVLGLEKAKEIDWSDRLACFASPATLLATTNTRWHKSIAISSSSDISVMARISYSWTW